MATSNFISKLKEPASMLKFYLIVLMTLMLIPTLKGYGYYSTKTYYTYQLALEFDLIPNVEELCLFNLLLLFCVVSGLVFSCLKSLDNFERKKWIDNILTGGVAFFCLGSIVEITGYKENYPDIRYYAAYAIGLVLSIGQLVVYNSKNRKYQKYLYPVAGCICAFIIYYFSPSLTSNGNPWTGQSINDLAYRSGHYSLWNILFVVSPFISAMLIAFNPNKITRIISLVLMLLPVLLLALSGTDFRINFMTFLYCAIAVAVFFQSKSLSEIKTKTE